MKDSFGRNIEYLRLSLTDRCNLRCSYCRDKNATPSNYEISADCIKRIVHCMVSLGITKVRFTGGEPLMRQDLEEVIAAVRVHPSVHDICMTTNAHGLASRVRELKKAGLMRINISLDSLRQDRFREITGGGSVNQVFEGIESSIDAGLYPIKVNCVVIKGKNDDEVGDFIALAKEKPLHVRFIELMPMGGSKNGELCISTGELLGRFPELSPVGGGGTGPAMEYTAAGFRGTVGFISPITRPFCNDCNRVRITHDGKLRPCLGDNKEIDLLEILNRNDSSLQQVIERAIFNKPKGHRFNDGFVSQRQMGRIGG